MAPDHPLLATAPMLPEYMQSPAQPFLSTTTHTLTSAQSQSFVDKLMASYQFPPCALEDWTQAITLRLSRRWPMETEPLAAHLAVFDQHSLDASIDLALDASIDLEGVGSALSSTYYGSFHRNLFAGLLIVQLLKQFSTKGGESTETGPWLLLRMESQLDNHLLRCVPYGIEHATPAACATLQVVERDFLLYPNPTGVSPAWLGTLRTPEEWTALPVIQLGDLFVDRYPYNRPALEVINEKLLELNALYHQQELQLFSC